MKLLLCILLNIRCPQPGLVSTADLQKEMDRALANGWEPVGAADAPPSSPGYAIAPSRAPETRGP